MRVFFLVCLLLIVFSCADDIQDSPPPWHEKEADHENSEHGDHHEPSDLEHADHEHEEHAAHDEEEGDLEPTEHDADDDEAAESEDHPENNANPLSADQMHALHAKIDANGDGKISMVEVMTFASNSRQTLASKDLDTIFASIDSDKDGKISLEERLKDLTGSSEDEDEEVKKLSNVEKIRFKSADLDGDGFLNVEESSKLFNPDNNVLSLMAEASFKEWDADGNGEVSMEEFWSGVHVDLEHEASEEEKAEFTRLDADKNGVLNLAEVNNWESGIFHTEEAMKQMFALVDVDKDTYITADELSKAREQLAAAQSPAHFHLTEWAEQNDGNEL